jgi:hypothetical protein
MDKIKILDLCAQSKRDLLINGFVVTSITVALILDSNATPSFQYFMGFCGWLVLAFFLYGEKPLVRYQIIVAVIFATLGEYISSPLLAYIYRLGDVPPYVPPGHGLVYLAAVAFARSALFTHYRKIIAVAAILIGATWALWGATLAERQDVMGLILFLIFLGFLRFGQAPHVYVCAFFLTSYLELLGTHLQTWAWSPEWPTQYPVVSQGNPPSGCPAWYCLVDAVAMAGAPLLAVAVGWGKGIVWSSPATSEEEAG